MTNPEHPLEPSSTSPTSAAEPDSHELLGRELKVWLETLRPPSPEEVERRRVLAAHVLQLRNEMRPLGIRVDELLAEVRGEDSESDG